MKKLLLILTVMFLTKFVNGQILDTVYVRHLTLQAQDWAYLVGKNANGINNDSIAIVAFRKIRTAAQAVQNPTWATNITIDSLPGRIVLAFYQTVKNGNAGEVETRYTAISNAIAAKTVLAYWLGRMDQQGVSDYQRFRDLGRQILIDK